MARTIEISGMSIPAPALQPGQVTEVVVVDVRTGGERVVLRHTELLLEAPNWSLDGAALILNGDFELWRLDIEHGRLEPIVTEDVPYVNNDHVLDPDGAHIYVSAFDWKIHRVPLAGGRGTCVSGESGIPHLMQFLHGIDPRGERLAFIGLRPGRGGDVFTVSTAGDDYVQLTDGPGHSDGCEYSPDGEWIYCNTENFDGHAQIGRMRPDGSGAEQLTFDDRVNWFPHLSPDGQWASYIAFAPGTEGHPANVWVDVKLVRGDDWGSATTVARVFGGQGTMNVNSWAPDRSAFAYVRYPLETTD